MPKSIQYNAYQSIKFCKNTTEDDLYNLFGDSIGVMDDRGNEIKDYFKHKYNKRNGWNN
jgi:hypothetical protein